MQSQVIDPGGQKNNFSIEIFSELFNLGLSPIPVVWDVEKKVVVQHPLHVTGTTGEKPLLSDVKRWLSSMTNVNGIALKLFPPFGMFDFDLKNTENKNVYHEWFNIVSETNEGILKKICIEKTRSGGYHVYIKYPKLSRKIPIARSNGQEVISLYTGGLLSYCVPSPNYTMIHNGFEDIEELTEAEFEFLVSTAAMFNEDEEYRAGQSTVQLIEYPSKYENVCLQFDSKCSDDVFESLLNSIKLYEVKDRRLFQKKDFTPYLRKGSTAAYSAKAYFRRYCFTR